MKVKNVLVSQPVPANPEKSPFAEVAKKFNLAITYHPFIRVQGVTLKEFRSQRVEVLDHTAVIFSSRTTVDHFFRLCEEARITIPETMKYLCNTEAVALYLQKYIVYRKRKIFFADGSFNGFMELILKHKEERFLLALSEPHKPELPVTMEKLRLRFDKVILSRTVGADLSDVDVRKFDLIAFYSPSEIATLVAAFGTENLPRIAAFGDGTVKAAIEAGVTVNTMAPSPEAPSMTRAVELYLTRLAAGEEVPPVQAVDSHPSEAFIKAQESRPSRRSRAKSLSEAGPAAKTESRRTK